MSSRGVVAVPLLLVVGLAGVGVVAAGPAGAADPFYEQLFETGISHYARGDFHTAAEDLRLACFGLLEEPAELAECLTYLAVAQAESGDAEAFGHTVDRLLEVERRFEAFSALDLDAGLTSALEDHLVSFIPFEVLDRSVVFREAGRRKRQAEILEMEPVERRRELERRLAAEPEDPVWRLMMAELDLAAGELEAAWTAAGTLLEHDAQRPRARCVRGRAGAALGWCELALPDLASCDAPDVTRDLIELRLRCHLRLQDFAGADAALAELGADERQKSPFRQLARELTRAKKAAARAAAAAPPAAAGEAEAAAGEAEAAAGEAETAEMDIVAGAASASDDGEPVPAGDDHLRVVDFEAGNLDGSLSEGVAGDAPPAAESEPPPSAPPARREQEAEMLDGETADAAARERVLAELERTVELVGSGSRAELDQAFTETRRLADSNPLLPEAQVLAAEIAYRLSRWEDAVRYFRRAGELKRPERLFYFSVALYEAGDRAAARELLDRCVPFLEPTDFVRSYSRKILNGE